MFDIKLKLISPQLVERDLPFDVDVQQINMETRESRKLKLGKIWSYAPRMELSEVTIYF